MDILPELIVKILHIEGLSYGLNYILQSLECAPKEIRAELAAIGAISEELLVKIIEVRDEIDELV